MRSIRERDLGFIGVAWIMPLPLRIRRAIRTLLFSWVVMPSGYCERSSMSSVSPQYGFISSSVFTQEISSIPTNEISSRPIAVNDLAIALSLALQIRAGHQGYPSTLAQTNFWVSSYSVQTSEDELNLALFLEEPRLLLPGPFQYFMASARFFSACSMSTSSSLALKTKASVRAANIDNVLHCLTPSIHSCLSASSLSLMDAKIIVASPQRRVSTLATSFSCS
mmetsp:Transcript_6953/g.15167  ORF Transcript_6953/g.15167 Transcript_6953/m.15167 type:complete len:223 (+) Transcript_6953:147-815(+)